MKEFTDKNVHLIKWAWPNLGGRPTPLGYGPGISVLNYYLSWSKFVNTHLSHSRQRLNIGLHLSKNRF